MGGQMLRKCAGTLRRPTRATDHAQAEATQLTARTWVADNRWFAQGISTTPIASNLMVDALDVMLPHPQRRQLP
jgi:hypothetical protein